MSVGLHLEEEILLSLSVELAIIWHQLLAIIAAVQNPGEAILSSQHEKKSSPERLSGPLLTFLAARLDMGDVGDSDQAFCMEDEMMTDPAGSMYDIDLGPGRTSRKVQWGPVHSAPYSSGSLTTF